MRRHNFILIQLFFVLCIKSVHVYAQQTQQTAAPAGTQPPANVLNSIQTNTSTAPAATPPAGAPGNLVNNVQKTPEKYAEHQSTCRGEIEQDKKLSAQEYATLIKLSLKDFEELKTVQGFEDILNIYIQQNNTDEAYAFLNKEKKILNKSEEVVFEARILHAKGRFNQAAVKLENFLKEVPNDINSLLELTKAYRSLKNYYDAKVALQDAIKATKKKDVRLIKDLCIIEVEDSNHTDAAEACKLAVNQNPKDPIPLIYLGISLREKTEYQEARKNFERSLRIKPSEFAYSCLGEIMYLQNDYKNSQDAFRKATEINPKSGRAALGTALTFYTQKEYDKAITYFIKSCEIDKKNIVPFKEAYNSLKSTKNPEAENYFQAIQKCVARSNY